MRAISARLSGWSRILTGLLTAISINPTTGRDGTSTSLLATVRHQSNLITALEIANVCPAWRVMRARWNELKVGDAIQLEWASIRSRNRHH